MPSLLMRLADRRSPKSEIRIVSVTRPGDLFRFTAASDLALRMAHESRSANR